jgi:hypothetical protein
MAAMSRHLALVAGLALLGVSVAVTPASAQFMQLFGFPSAEPPPPLPPEAIAARLARFNYKLTRLRRGPQGYIAEAIDPAGRPVRLIMDPIDGALLQRTVLGPPPEASPGGGGATPPQERAPSTRSLPSTRQNQPAQSRDAAPKAGASEPAQAASAPASPAAPAKPAEPFVPKTGPGYSYGVPINPLD